MIRSFSLSTFDTAMLADLKVCDSLRIYPLLKPREHNHGLCFLCNTGFRILIVNDTEYSLHIMWKQPWMGEAVGTTWTDHNLVKVN